MNLLIKKFVTSKDGGDGRKRRELCGRLSGATGIGLNLLLGVIKLFVGFISGSIAVMADAVNNLSDAAASIITLVGFSLAARRSDEGHPFGHARIEYMTGILVSALIIIIGFVLVLQSYQKIISPEPLTVSAVAVVLLILPIGVKLWMFFFNKKLASLIGSASLKATSIDSRNDVIVNSGVLASLLLWRFGGILIDGYVGVAIGVFVIYSGIGLIRETAAPLLGQPPDPQTVREIIELIKSEQDVVGFHDLIVHEYGPEHDFATVHIEVDASKNIFKLHEMIDRIEQEALDRYRVQLVGHMDPVDVNDPKLNGLRETLTRALKGSPGFLGFHDLRIIPGSGRTNVVFDIVVSHDAPEKSFEEAKRRAQKALNSAAKDGERLTVVANCDLNYVPGWTAHP